MLVVLWLTGCSYFGGKEDYQKASSSRRLEAPPELVIPQTGDTYNIPEVVRASEVNAGQTAGSGAVAPQTPVMVSSGVLPEYGNSVIESNDQSRWLKIKASPEALWEPLETFWSDQEIKLDKNDKALGVMKTEWIDESLEVEQGQISSFFRKSLGRIGGADIKARYNIRLERSEEGSRIFLTREATEKVFEEGFSGEPEGARWNKSAPNPEAEAEMLTRIQQYLANR
jgi:outer membrane protein assembly factor BamC